MEKYFHRIVTSYDRPLSYTPLFWLYCGFCSVIENKNLLGTSTTPVLPATASRMGPACHLSPATQPDTAISTLILPNFVEEYVSVWTIHVHYPGGVKWVIIPIIVNKPCWPLPWVWKLTVFNDIVRVIDASVTRLCDLSTSYVLFHMISLLQCQSSNILATWCYNFTLRIPHSTGTRKEQ